MRKRERKKEREKSMLSDFRTSILLRCAISKDVDKSSLR